MDILATFFESNQSIIFFAYGLAFFIMGLAVALQSRQFSRLELARSLNWLAGFGILHGLNEWGDLFIPIQATYLSAPVVNLLYVIQLVLLALSFASLFSFGVSLLKPLGKLKWLSNAPMILFVAWVFITFFVLTTLYQTQMTWHHASSALARYLIAFPGGLLAAYGLREHAIRRILPLGVSSIYNALRISGITLGVYAILGGLIPPPTPFWPGNVLNADTVQMWIGIPPLVFRALIGFILAIATIRALEVFNLETERLIENLEHTSIVNAERERIARDLHDGAIQKVYTAGLLVRSISKFAQPQSEISQRTERAVAALSEAVTELRINLEALHKETSTPIQPLVDLLRSVAENPHYTTMADLKLDTNLEPGFSLSPVQSGHVMGIVNETMANIFRHARARHIHINAEGKDGSLRITIHDDGVGFMPGTSSGHGLQNMRDRARLLNGTLEIDTKPGKGTTVTLELPWKEQQ